MSRDGDLAIARRRLTNLVEGARRGSPREVLRWLVAVQAQELAIASWSIGQRLQGAVEADLTGAVDRGELLRTHVLRQTWHLVLPDDIRWLLTATGPRIQARNAPIYRDHGLDERTRGRCRELIASMLAGGNHLTRRQIGQRLADVGVEATGQRLAIILMDAEAEAVVCSGARQGSAQTYALLEERAPDARRLDPDDAIIELTRRYLTSHGPATEKDLRSWSSLRATELKPAFEHLREQLVREEHDGRTYWSAGERAARPPTSPARVHLLQPYDEFLLGYVDTRHVVDTAGHAGSLHPDAVIPNNVVVVDGQLAGNWWRGVDGDEVVIDAYLFEPPDEDVHDALRAEADSYGRFVDRPVRLTVHDHRLTTRRWRAVD